MSILRFIAHTFQTHVRLVWTACRAPGILEHGFDGRLLADRRAILLDSADLEAQSWSGSLFDRTPASTEVGEKLEREFGRVFRVIQRGRVR